MKSLDLLYSGLIYTTGAMLILWTGMLLAAAFVAFTPPRNWALLAARQVPGSRNTQTAESDQESSELAARSS